VARTQLFLPQAVQPAIPVQNVGGLPGFESLLALCLAMQPPECPRSAGTGCNDRIANLDCCSDDRGQLHLCFIPQRLLLCRKAPCAPSGRRSLHLKGNFTPCDVAIDRQYLPMNSVLAWAEFVCVGG